jgi:KTSC domain
VTRLDKWASSFLDVIRIQGESARKALDSRMQRVPVESSSIASIGYASQERVLELEFRQSGEVYQYFDVPAEEYTAFLAADSKGTYVNQQLKPLGYRYQRLPSSSK